MSPDDPRARLLIEAGVDLLPTQPDFDLTTPFNNLAEDPAELQQVFNNLNELYAEGFNLSEDILQGATVADVISHLETAKVEQALNFMKKNEQKLVADTTRAELANLKDDIDPSTLS